MTIKKISETDYLGATVIEVMNLDYENLSAKEFLHQGFK